MEKSNVPRGKRPRVQVSLDDKERAIQRIRNGETKAGISRELGVPESTVRGWVKRAEQRIAREAVEQNQGTSTSILGLDATAATTTTIATIIQPLAMQTLKMAKKRNAEGQPIQVPNTNGVTLMPMQLPMPVPQSTENDENITSWLHIFNAGILNFTYIATAAYMQASARGTAERQTLWQIINDYVEEAGRNVANNNGQYIEPASKVPSPRTRQSYRSSTFVAPRLHITAEDDEDEGSTGPEMEN